MTIREGLHRRRRRLFLIAFALWLGFIPSMLATAISPYFAPLLVLCFVGFGACILSIMLRLRCPNCGNNLGYAVQWPPAWGISGKIRYCPYCGIDLDTDERDIRRDDAGGTP
jgi:hypothetical protein